MSKSRLSLDTIEYRRHQPSLSIIFTVAIKGFFNTASGSMDLHDARLVIANLTAICDKIERKHAKSIAKAAKELLAENAVDNIATLNIANCPEYTPPEGYQLHHNMVASEWTGQPIEKETSDHE